MGSSKYDHHLKTDHLTGELKERSVHAGFVTACSQVVKFVLQTVSTMVLARILTPRDYGLVGMAMVVTNFVLHFKDLGLAIATVQREHVTHEQVSVLFWVNLAFSGVLACVIASLAPLLAQFYGEPRLVGITLAIAGTFLLGGATIQHQALLRRQMRFTALAVVDVISLFSGIVFAILAAWRGDGYWSLIYMQWVTTLTNTIGVWVACGWRPGPLRRGSNVREMLAFGRRLASTEVMGYIGRSLDQILIGRYCGAQALGYYGRAYSFLLLPLQQVSGPITAVAVPALSRLVGEPERYRRAFIMMFEKVLMITMPLVFWMVVSSNQLILVALGPQWKEASKIFSVLGCLGLAQAFSNAALWVFISQGRGKLLLRWSALNTFLVAIGVIGGLPWGALGVAIGYAMTGIFVRTPIMLWVVGSIRPVRMVDYYRTAVPFAIAACIMGIAIGTVQRFLLGGAVVRLLTSFILAAGIYLLVLAIIPAGRCTIVESKEIIMNVLRNFFHERRATT
jgi:O-antigen/teichoic acid export membrane protein